MNQKRNKKRIGFLLLILLLVAMTGCGKKETPTTTAMKQETTKEETSKKETTVSSGKAESKGKYTIEEIAQDIEFDGKKISLPTTLKELGDEYTYDGTPTNYGDEAEIRGWYADSIIYADSSKMKDEWPVLTTATILSSDGNITNDSIICGLLTYEDDAQSNKFSIKGIKFGDSLEKIRKILGKEDYIKQEGTITCYSYGEEKGNHVDFGFKEGNDTKLNKMRIIFEK